MASRGSMGVCEAAAEASGSSDARRRRHVLSVARSSPEGKRHYRGGLLRWLKETVGEPGIRTVRGVVVFAITMASLLLCMKAVQLLVEFPWGGGHLLVLGGFRIGLALSVHDQFLVNSPARPGQNKSQSSWIDGERSRPQPEVSPWLADHAVLPLSADPGSHQVRAQPEQAQNLHRLRSPAEAPHRFPSRLRSQWEDKLYWEDKL